MLSRPMRSVIQVIGTTGVGKSQLGIDLAKYLNGEIINSDSMQVYHGMDIITNKHPLEKRDGVPHHLLGFVQPGEEYRIGTYESDATAIIDELHATDKVPIVVGGTAYYSTSLLFKDMLPSSLPVDTVPNDAESISSTHKVTDSEAVTGLDPRLEMETDALYAQLERIDPVMATRWHPRDRRKIRRSLEIYYTTGKRQSDLYAEQRAQGRLGPETVRYRTLVVWLHCDQSILDARLDARVEDMIQAGLFQEVSDFFASQQSSGEIDFTRGINQSIGFKQFQKYLISNDPKDKQSGIEEMKAATRRYARKQVKWIRNKLLLQCRDAGSAVQVILLDASDLDQWQNTVLAKGLAAVTDFLSNEHFNPADYVESRLAPMLVPKIQQEFSRAPEAWEKYECPECPTFTTNSKAGWTEHLGSHAHRSNVKKGKKRAEFESWKKRQKRIHNAAH